MILGLSGWARAGKDTVADYLVDKYGFVKMSFASPMREALYRLNPRIQVAQMHAVPLATVVDSMGWEELKAVSPDIRPLMQRLGTEVGREMFGENFWVDLAMKQAAQHERVVFADCRFQNEANAIKEANGFNWRISRPGFEAANDHISEHDLDDFKFNLYLNNAHQVTHLHDAIDALIGNVIG